MGRRAERVQCKGENVILKSNTNGIFDVDLRGKTNLRGSKGEGSSVSLLTGLVAGSECISQIVVITEYTITYYPPSNVLET